MEEKDIIAMSRKEWKRSRVIEEVIEKRITHREAASKIGLSERQVRRIAKRVRNEGIDGIKHRLRGKSSARKIPEAIKTKVVNLYQERYLGFGPTLAQEKLIEQEGIQKVARL